MNENLDLTKILKDCPSGVEFYSPMCGKITFNRINEKSTRRPIETDMYIFTTEGKYNLNGECMLFPSKEQRDWSKWHRPFKDGDIFVCSNLCGNHIAIYNNLKRSNFYGYYAIVTNDGEFNIDGICSGDAYRLATEEEKQKLFKALEDNGYKWNAEKKKLEKLIVPKFKVGDIIRKKDGTKECVITKIYGDLYDYVTSKTYKSPCFISRERGYFPIDRQDDYELIPDKFNPEFFKPFDKVLCRMNNDDIWEISLFERYAPTNPCPFFCIQDCFSQCVPYNDNTKHLVGTNNEAPEYYKCWEELNVWERN